MSNEKECTLCKHLGAKSHHEEGFVTRECLYDQSGAVITINLCRHHAVELFKHGQKRFLLKHYSILQDIKCRDNPKFLELLEHTIQKFPELIA